MKIEPTTVTNGSQDWLINDRGIAGICRYVFIQLFRHGKYVKESLLIRVKLVWAFILFDMSLEGA